MEKRYKKYRNYLEIVYEILKEDALEAKKERMEKYKKYKDYLETVCEILKKKALEAKKVSKKYRLLGEEENPRSLFHSGRSLAYYGAVDTLYDYAIILEIDLKK